METLAAAVRPLMWRNTKALVALEGTTLPSRTLKVRSWHASCPPIPAPPQLHLPCRGHACRYRTDAPTGQSNICAIGVLMCPWHSQDKRSSCRNL